jgi:hypothetical protein
MPSLLSVVDWNALLQTAWASVAAGLGITLAFSVAIYGAVRTVELRRDERPMAASLAGALMLLGLAVSVAGIVFGVIVMTTK